MLIQSHNHAQLLATTCAFFKPAFVSTVNMPAMKGMRTQSSSTEVPLIDLFCGAGGFSCGAMRAGMRPILGVDSSDNALQVFKENHHRAEVGLETLGKESAESFAARLVDFAGGRHFHLHGSPPCQALCKFNTKASER